MTNKKLTITIKEYDNTLLRQDVPVETANKIMDLLQHTESKVIDSLKLDSIVNEFAELDVKELSTNRLWEIFRVAGDQRLYADKELYIREGEEKP